MEHAYRVLGILFLGAATAILCRAIRLCRERSHVSAIAWIVIAAGFGVFGLMYVCVAVSYSEPTTFKEIGVEAASSRQ